MPSPTRLPDESKGQGIYSRFNRDPVSSQDEVDVCPLCVETFDVTDARFFPCASCKFQVCRLCVSQLRSEPSSWRCPGCREPYDEAKFVLVSDEAQHGTEDESRHDTESEDEPRHDTAAAESEDGDTAKEDRTFVKKVENHAGEGAVAEASIPFAAETGTCPANEEDITKEEGFPDGKNAKKKRKKKNAKNKRGKKKPTVKVASHGLEISARDLQTVGRVDEILPARNAGGGRTQHVRMSLHAGLDGEEVRVGQGVGDTEKTPSGPTQNLRHVFRVAVLVVGLLLWHVTVSSRCRTT